MPFTNWSIGIITMPLTPSWEYFHSFQWTF